MKKTIYLLLIFVSTLSAGFSIISPENSETILMNIQEKIYDAFVLSLQGQDTKPLTEIQQKIKQIEDESHITTYWMAYAKYYESIYYLKVNDTKNAKAAISTGINLIEDVPNKDSEYYALLAHLQSFSTQFAEGISAMLISNKTKENAKSALKLDSTNLRAWYVLGCNDYYTPKAYGGKQKCEEYFQKSISLENQTIKNPYMPSWGKDDAFALLVAYYINENEIEKAREYLKKALSLYPDNYMLNQYAEEIKKEH